MKMASFVTQVSHPANNERRSALLLLHRPAGGQLSFLSHLTGTVFTEPHPQAHAPQKFCLILILAQIGASQSQVDTVHLLTSSIPVGELVEASGSEEEDEASAEQYEAEQREKLEQERAAIMNDSTLIAEVSPGAGQGGGGAGVGAGQGRAGGLGE